MNIYNFDFANLLLTTADYGLIIQLDNGGFPPGQNGPHKHRMTGARTTCHWSIILSFAYKVSKDQKYLKAANKAYDVLISSYRPLEGAFWHRFEDFKNSYNGLIGQAWTLEALYWGHTLLERSDLYEVGQRLSNVHRFNDDLGLWHEADLDGSARNINMTLNQQIWFTALASRFIDDELDICKIFLDKLEQNLIIHKSGLLYIGIKDSNFIRKLQSTINNVYTKGLFDKNKTKDFGYHIFTLVGLTILYEKYPSHEFYKSTTFNKALQYAFSSNFHHELQSNAFGYPYNVPGFEIVYIYENFKDKITSNANEVVKESLKYQLKNHLDKNGLLTINTTDPNTLLSRTYETCRIPIAKLNEYL